MQTVSSLHEVTKPIFLGKIRKIFDWNFYPWMLCLFVLRFYGPFNPNGVMSSAVSLPNHMFTGQAKSSKQLTSIVHILSPETDNCPSWISGRERMTIENISWSISTKECCWTRRGSNPWPPGLQSDGVSNWATEAGPYPWMQCSESAIQDCCENTVKILFKFFKWLEGLIFFVNFLQLSCLICHTLFS